MDDNTLHPLLRSVSRVTLVLEVLRALAGGLAIFVIAVVLAVSLDAILGFQERGLVLLDGLLVATLAVLGGYTIREAYRNFFRPLKTACQIESRLGISDSRLRNAVDFLLSPPSDASPLLVKKSIDIGDSLAAELDILDCVSLSRIWRPAGLAVGILTFTLLSYVALPKAYGMVVPRLLDPWGDHPPYTLLDFDIQNQPEVVHYGQSSQITVTLTGPQLPLQADLVVMRTGDQPTRIPMLRTDNNVFQLPIEHLTADLRYYVDTPLGRSSNRDIFVRQIPLLEDASVEYEFPAYTTWARQRHRLDGRGIKVLRGTQITLEIKSNLELKSGTLTLRAMSDTKSVTPNTPSTFTLHPVAGDARRVKVTMTPESSGRFELSIIGHNGIPSVDTLEGPLQILEDRPPQVTIRSPERVVSVVENWKVPISLEAQDDIGVARLQLFRSINGWEPIPVDVSMATASGSTLISGGYEFNLQALGAQPGDIITYFARATDECPSRAQSTDTELHIIEVISHEQFIDLARQNYQVEEMQQEVDDLRRHLEELRSVREDLLRDQQQVREQLSKTPEPNPEDLKEEEELRKNAAQFAESVKGLADELQKRADETQLYDVEQQYTELLQKLRRQLERQQQYAEELAERLEKHKQNPTPSTAGDLESAMEQLQQESAPFDDDSQTTLEKSSDDLKLLQQANEMLGEAERLRSTALKQREMARRLGEQTTAGMSTEQQPSAAPTLARDQELIQHELQDAMQALRSAAERAAQSLPRMSAEALKLLQDMEQQRITSDQAIAAQKARDGQIDQARTAAEAAADKLDSALSRLTGTEQAGTEVSEQMDGPLQLPAADAQNSLDQLAQGRQMPGASPKSRPSQQNGSSTDTPSPDRSNPSGTSTSPIDQNNARASDSADGMGHELANGQWQQATQQRPGSRPRKTVMGPHIQPPTPPGQLERAGLMDDRKGDGLASSRPSDDNTASETLSLESNLQRVINARSLRGVPVGYRDQAEAYFRRLSDGK